jgi:hypothetical protein
MLIMWKAPYIHQFPSSKLGGVVCLLLKDVREIIPTCKCKNPPIHTPREINIGSIHDKLSLVLYDR